MNKQKGCDNCHKLYLELNSKIKELENQLEKYENLCGSQGKTIRRQAGNIKEINSIAKEWMQDYDKLKAKHEPEIFTSQEKRIKELEKEIESLKPQKKASARCPKCKKVVPAHSLDLLTGCCEGGCEQ